MSEAHERRSTIVVIGRTNHATPSQLMESLTTALQSNGHGGLPVQVNESIACGTVWELPLCRVLQPARGGRRATHEGGQAGHSVAAAFQMGLFRARRQSRQEFRHRVAQ